jgi:hypothetical protein
MSILFLFKKDNDVEYYMYYKLHSHFSKRKAELEADPEAQGCAEKIGAPIHLICQRPPPLHHDYSPLREFLIATT